MGAGRDSLRLSQSLLHQVKYSSLTERGWWTISASAESQSLLHQVKYSSRVAEHE